MPARSIGSNYTVNVVANGREHFELALCLAFNGNSASHYAVYPKPFGLVFFWWIPDSDWMDGIVLNERNENGEYAVCDPETGVKPKHPLCMGECLDIAWDWLSEQPKERYPLQGRWNDISYEKGFEITAGNGGNIGNHQGIICMVKPTWMLIGK